ncbi:hypothetical protein OG948_46020 (plasmid) [Embleya sp. NBC_00888]|uniref:hypothetical protein n=1 Tax=Embleya sp. NBC_00888 TaxID=2975960 RepID=UPI002F90BC76|nr:hypothetical protein OG948_46020 [Embleya sp. NBC_00888]
MSDLYELTMALAIRGPLSGGEVAELRWHAGLGGGVLPASGARGIVTEFPVVVVDDFGVPTVEDDPRPVLGRTGMALRVGGESTADVTPTAGGWVVSVRQELHPDEFDAVGVLLTWLAARADDAHTSPDGSVVLGRLRFLEDIEPAPLMFRDGRVNWPDREAG